ncbi:tRNA (adenosine(37)-N6)-dimethylallyltransferase MiaA [Candidatus Nomurabacteria bacterium RIFCSPHIGHO2_01_FULL_37_25]|uniref:tRNA dimethylallyltransferase n=1 Tax=Candidatus Nomurabacteria bacterium RIFCSPLOWO2_01_FULL_36_16 TaxID=1801767 RepID=A0A1F6WZM9_9BACT|nr:MAG: tRNA (adenosine(37)-N6)-dimethylallyltransferase MiaA [Candidatus Nomurabacteria bacterium RIFCSPHIGHO2_01_FULL_37_25]OGI75484.1 MAG: tRNA (adenosine(37)-N6)-dimethylallyltransferase MiaA [Candidatus Nomurabacteria bacterium RIFCSPHIGHO2_02_FULL_36_29]OGI87322.1 MAG: tRNA (adenosine(37)-N6)-dimethylallyltransferase MiaA [Candidatus Nomurabacteria bacterium RIFCSPLOWO2_01_FULL_36_16]OGI94871.1 MAG: tRNA (adenosine(37)-N6)-dimethylallyltransferase MiaA [Candidatus Nomurabacteria bacterium 
MHLLKNNFLRGFEPGGARIIVILGQTATGKSDLAVKIAKKIGGEIISADSRQVYKGLDIGTGKITEKEMQTIPHYLLDVANPKKQFTVAQYKILADKKIKEVIDRDKIPILCGGTGFYIDAVTKGMIFPKVPPNKKLRKDLEQKTAETLFNILKKLDKDRAKSIDSKNKVRLIRAIEIAKALGEVPKITEATPPYKFIKIGLKVPEKTLKRKIRIRLRKRIRSGMAIELYNLRKAGVPWKRFIELGFDQKYIALFLQGKISNKEMLEKLFKSNWQYAKRQMTWFKRDKEIKWFSPVSYKKIKIYIENKL